MTSIQPGVVAIHACSPRRPEGHEHQSHVELSRRIAALKGYDFAGEFDPTHRYDRPVYLVPSDTLIGTATAEAFGIRNEQDLFGGVAPYAFIATKAITHGLPQGHTAAPEGWSTAFSKWVDEVVLPGYSAFSRADARSGGMALLQYGKVRVKKTSGIGGLGQWVAETEAELDDCLDSLDAEAAWNDGVTLEANLSEVVTYSVGQARIGDLLLSYWGTQGTTPNHQGEDVYGGSRLVVVRGDFDALLQLDMEDEVQTAVRQATAYHAAAIASFPGFFASRANYDVARGIDDAGRCHSGVLEQSWRLGGASAAELAAAEAFREDPALRVVQASTVEVYGPADLPPDARIHYQGVDPVVGALTKYSRIEAYAHT